MRSHHQNTKEQTKISNLQKSKLQLTRQTRQLPSAISKWVTGHPAIVVGAKEHLGAVMNFAAPEKRKRKNIGPKTKDTTLELSVTCETSANK